MTTRVLQGAANPTVTVTGLAIVTGTEDRRNPGLTMCIVGAAMTLGLMSDPILGVKAFELGGFNTVWIMPIVILFSTFFFLEPSLPRELLSIGWSQKTTLSSNNIGLFRTRTSPLSLGK